MKHLLNNLSDSERERILEQYNNSLIVETKKFNKLINSKSGDIKPLVNEQESESGWSKFFTEPMKMMSDTIEKGFVGKKIKLLNRMFIYGREMAAVNIRGGMNNYNEDISLNQFDCSPTLISITPDTYYVKVDYLNYDPKNERKRGEKGEYKTLNNVCLKIPKNQVISFEDGVMQVDWFNSFIQNHIIDCNSIPTSGEEKKQSTQDCLKDFKIRSGYTSARGGYNYKIAERNDGVKIDWDFTKKQWNDTYEKYTPGSDKKEVGKWKCENGNFVMYDKKSQIITYY